MTVPYPRPRNLPAIRADPSFGALRAHVWELLKEEIRELAEEAGHG